MISALLISLLAQQAPTSNDFPARELTWDWMESTIIEDQVVYRIQGLKAQTFDRTIVADLCEVRFNQELYLQSAAEKKSGTRIPSSETTGNAFHQSDRGLANSFGLTNRDGLVVSFELSGNVLLSSPSSTLACDQMLFHAASGETLLQNADLQLPAGAGPKGWPLRLICESLREDKDGQLHATNARLTTCDSSSPHYSLSLKELTGTPVGANSYRWKPAGAWLKIANLSFLPLPAPEIDETGVNENAFIGFRGIRLHSNNRLGQALEIDFGSSGRSDNSDLYWNWDLSPSWSTTRGFPTKANIDLVAGKLSSNSSFFALHDLGEDVHPFSRRISRWSKNRWMATSDNTYLWNENWRAEMDLSFASDPLVDPEFNYRDWLRNDDSQSELYLHGKYPNAIFETSFSAVTDRSGFAPLTGYDSGISAPGFSESLPLVRFSGLPRTIYEVPFLSGRKLPLNFSFGGEFGRLRLRELAPKPADGSLSFLTSPVMTRDRLRLWAATEIPAKLGPINFNFGTRWDGLGYSQDINQNDNPGKSLLETKVELGVLLTKNFGDGWRHRVLPQIRWRDRSYDGRDPSILPQFDFYDAMTGGSALEFSLRQFFMPPQSDQAWVDIDFMIPHYLDPQNPLVDPLFPSYRNPVANESWGPAEFRLSWTPEAAGKTLAPLRLDTRLRKSAQGGEDEIFTRLSFSEDQDFMWGASLSKVDSLFSFAETWGSWRLTDSIGVELGLPWRFDELSARRSRAQINWYAHDFILQLGMRRDTSIGETGFFFNVLPRFLIEGPNR